MFVKALVSECDFTGTKYDGPVEGAYIYNRGASGRWCVTMYAGPEWLSMNGMKVESEEALESYVRENGQPHDYIEWA